MMTENPVNILLVEDEPQIRRFVRGTLEDAGWRVMEAETGQRGLIDAGTRRPDLLILDLGLPDMDGVELIRDFRAWSNAPVLILSARSDETQKIEALDAGADDFLTKPFGTGELVARVRALIRRLTRQQESTPQIEFGNVTVDFSRREVVKNDLPVHLTPIEYRLLCALLSSQGKVLTHRTLMQQVWGPNHNESSHYLRIYMSRLRQKIENDPTQPVHFLTVSGIGYRFQF